MSDLGSPADVERAVTQACVAARDSIKARVAVHWIEGRTSASRPQLFECDDGSHFAVKLRQNDHGDGRAISTEQIVPRLGQLVGARVPEASLIQLQEDMIDFLEEKKAGGLDINFTPAPGLHHGSMWAFRYSDREGVRGDEYLRESHAALQVLYSWIGCEGDHQVIYSEEPPHEVLSVDHSMFFPGGLGWTPETLKERATSVTRDSFFDPAGIDSSHRQAALDRLEALSVQDLARAVAAPPEEWGVTVEERIAIVEYLFVRRDLVRGAVN